MRKLMTVFGLATVWAAIALAENFSGQLIDASCTDKQTTEATCMPSSSTTAFAVNVGGKVYKLDNSGNSKAVDALKSRADRSTDPNAAQKAAVVVKISGTKQGDTIQVDSLEVQ